ncbi:MAG: methyltransferase domain-containing protein [Candidatus Rokubacteria bacterium]|nr:methyltransferase domain-containing protein [Candidatus Rokubacteria bacterium]
MTDDTTQLFDRMADTYDTLEPWYVHLYERLDALLRTTLAPPRPGARALDAGCGTGFQTATLRALGWTVHGVDLSAGLLAVARRKWPSAPLACGDLETLPYRDAAFDAVACCGSTLSFVATPARTLAEIARVLRPGGRLVLECEHKWSLDLVWTVASALVGDPLGYGVTPKGAWRQVARPLREGFRLDYPAPLPDGGQAYMRLRTFTMAELGAMLTAAGFRVRRVAGIHAITNVLPSTLLHRERLARPLEGVYRGLCALDRALTASGAWWLANSLVVSATRELPSPARSLPGTRTPSPAA